MATITIASSTLMIVGGATLITVAAYAAWHRTSFTDLLNSTA